ICLDAVEDFGEQLSGSRDYPSAAYRYRVDICFDLDSSARLRRRHRVEHSLAGEKKISLVVHRSPQRGLLQSDARERIPFSAVERFNSGLCDVSSNCFGALEGVRGSVCPGVEWKLLPVKCDSIRPFVICVSDDLDRAQVAADVDCGASVLCFEG